MGTVSRRSFLNATVASTAACGLLSKGAFSAPLLGGLGSSILGANDRIRLGVIGPGGQGKHMMRTFLENEEVDFVAISDIDDSRIAEAVDLVKEARPTVPDGYRDFRKVIDREDIDAILIATPDHWHALPTIYACEAGKDVYVEKPLATSIGEGRAMLEASKKYNRVVQMGTHWRSCPHYKEAVDFVHSGKLGKIRMVRCWAYLDWTKSTGNPPDGAPPDGVDYDLWLGPSPNRPFNPARFHYTFRWFWDYAGGLMTDWGVHLINLAMWGMNYPEPIKVSSMGGKFVLTDLMDTPDTQQAIYEFPEFSMIWEHQMKGGIGAMNRPHGVLFSGADATLILDSDGWEVIPEKEKSVAAEKHEGQDSNHSFHVRNFLDCMKTRELPVENLEVGHNVSSVAHLGNLAYMTGRTIHWDAENERILNDPEANRLVHKDYRAPWVLPGAATVGATPKRRSRRSWFCCPK
jgi:predicted dehydrogenase